MIPAVMLWMGPAAAFPFVFYMALVGGACALVILLVRRTLPAEAIPGFMRKPFENKANVPYGVAIAAGALFAGAGSPLLAGLFNTAGISG
jgi:prepilin peptidase CpaA